MGFSLLKTISLAAVTLCVACEPTFTPSSELLVDGEDFQPITCHVLTRATGVELFDEGGLALELTLPPARLKAFRDISGTPTVKLRQGPGRPGVVVGRCGSLTLTGEGYHGSGKRAASGQASLDCRGSRRLSGELSWSGCF